MTVYLSIRHVAKRFGKGRGEYDAIQNINLDVERGGKMLDQVHPAKFIYNESEMGPTTEVSQINGFRDDLYVVVGSIDVAGDLGAENDAAGGPQSAPDVAGHSGTPDWMGRKSIGRDSAATFNVVPSRHTRGRTALAALGSNASERDARRQQSRRSQRLAADTRPRPHRDRFAGRDDRRDSRRDPPAG